MSATMEGIESPADPRFAERSLRGDLPYGSWARHALEWSAAFDDPSVLFVRYEDMKADLPGVVRRVQRHIGGCDAADADAVAAACTFEAMKRDKAKYSPRTVELRPGFDFIRSGRVGDGQRDLGPEALKTLLDAKEQALSEMPAAARDFFA